jgi:hypothetical protein
MSILTNYRPNFCCECGNKIVRLRWFVWTSRRFCDQCFRTFARTQWLRPAVMLMALMLLGVVIGRGCRRAQPPLIIERTASTTSSASSASGPNTADPNATSAGAQSNTGASQTNSSTTQPVAPDQLYTCGARTKKGTPCSRRVHGPVRCWQHKGAKAMLPQEKLLVKE